MKPVRIRYDTRFLYLFIPLMFLEAFFHFIQFPAIDFYSLIRTVLFVLFFSVMICFILTRPFIGNKVYYIGGFILVVFFCVYCFAELIFKNFMGDFYSFGTVSDGAGRIAQYVPLFIKSARPEYYLCFVPTFIHVLLIRHVSFTSEGQLQYPLLWMFAALGVLMCIMDAGSSQESILEVYQTFSNKDIIIDRMGITHFLFRDLGALTDDSTAEVIIEDEPAEVIEDDPAEIIEEDIPEETLRREIDDSYWKSLLEKEENANMQTIDSYLMSRNITQPNEMTGVFEGYNFVYFMVEALDYLAIDEELTPTLFRMYQEGMTFYNHYTPLYSCATGESEYVGYTSLFPYTNVCTPNYSQNKKMYQALPWLFKDAGYATLSLHNWRDEFYDRNTLLPNLGFDVYYDIDDIWQDPSIPHVKGWQSDSMLVEQAIKHIDEIEGPFFCDIVTSVMHFPYDESSYYGDLYLAKVREVHPDWSITFQRYMSKSMDFDRGLEILLEYLDEKGILDNTVICIYADHRPYWMDYNTLMRTTSGINERTGEYGIYRSPFIIYNSTMEKNVSYNYCSTMDHVPTIANLFDLNYDPRLYMGSDAYAGSNTVIFTNGSWLNEKGIYDAARGTFTPHEGQEAPSDVYLKNLNSRVKNIMKISSLILNEDYFAKRKAITSPH